MPVIVFTMISIVYVLVVSRYINSAGQWGLLALSSASIVLKLSLQEVAKYMMIVVRRPVSRRVMVALVSTPTILVDTQVRILLLRQSNLNISIAGTVFIAFFEIVVRATKSTIVQRQTREPSLTRKSQRRSLVGQHKLTHVNASACTSQPKCRYWRTSTWPGRRSGTGRSGRSS